MKIGPFGPLEIVIILVVILVLFGPKNLPKLGTAIGKAVKNLREGLRRQTPRKKSKLRLSTSPRLARRQRLPKRLKKKKHRANRFASSLVCKGHASYGGAPFSRV